MESSSSAGRAQQCITTSASAKLSTASWSLTQSYLCETTGRRLQHLIVQVAKSALWAQCKAIICRSGPVGGIEKGLSFSFSEVVIVKVGLSVLSDSPSHPDISAPSDRREGGATSGSSGLCLAACLLFSWSSALSTLRCFDLPCFPHTVEHRWQDKSLGIGVKGLQSFPRRFAYDPAVTAAPLRIGPCTGAASHWKHGQLPRKSELRSVCLTCPGTSKLRCRRTDRSRLSRRRHAAATFAQAPRSRRNVGFHHHLDLRGRVSAARAAM